MKKNVIVLFLLSMLVFSFAKDMFRVHETQLVEMHDELQSYKARLGLNDMLVVALPKDICFLQGVSLEIKVPKAVLDYRDAVAFYVYRNISPTPTKTTIDYSGDRVFFNTFPGRLNYIFQIPIDKKHTLRETPYTALLPEVIEAREGYICFRLQLVMKGVPVTVLESEFDIEVKPILLDKGLLKLSLIPPNPHARQRIPGDETEIHGGDTSSSTLFPSPDKTNDVLFIDEKPVELVNNTIMLKSGTHHIAFVSEDFRNEVRTFTIEQAKTTHLAIQLETNEPTMELSVPESVGVYFDDILLTDFTKPYEITEGEHVVRFVLDGFERIKTFSALKGKTYTISTNLDFFIEEN